jgi:hypothetical protein
MSGKMTVIAGCRRRFCGLGAGRRIEGGYQGGAVQPCALAGINPSDHPGIFDNPARAREQYGFVSGPDGDWQVIPNCARQISR